MIAYVVTEGSYSDYHIVAVFSTEEKAKDFIRLHPKGSEEYQMIEEYPIDKLNLREEMPCVVEFWSYKNPKSTRTDCNLWDGDGEERIEYKDYKNGYGTEMVRVYVKAKDRDTAVKVAAERRAQYLANKNGI